VAGQPLHFEARAPHGAPVRITGDYEGPAPLLALIAGAVLYFG
jgi:hypothetical protein